MFILRLGIFLHVVIKCVQCSEHLKAFYILCGVLPYIVFSVVFEVEYYLSGYFYTLGFQRLEIRFKLNRTCHVRNRGCGLIVY